MKYPKLKRKDDLRIKLSLRDIANIRRIHEAGIKIAEIAKQFNVCWATVKYYVDDEYRTKMCAQTKVWKRHKLDTDIEFRKKHRLTQLRSNKHRREVNPLFYKYLHYKYNNR